jgi:NADPH:quinone reductase-like Zn-dependent oxidoreductase
MKAYRVERPGSFTGLVVREEAAPVPAQHQVVVGMKAVSLNYRDLLVALGRYPVPTLRPHVIPLSDGAGEVIAVGRDVTRVSAGDRVLVNFHQKWIDGPIATHYLGTDLGGSSDGVLAEHVLLDAEGVVPLPDYLSFEEGAAFGCASITAWAALVAGRTFIAGETLLVQGTGGVSVFALQFAKAMGGRVIATTSSDAKAERLRQLGADEVVNYTTTPQWDEAVLRLTDGRGVDRVIEVGGPGTLERSLRSCSIRAHVAIVGFLGGMAGAISPLALTGRNTTLQGVAVGSRRNLEDSLALARMHRLRPAVDRVFDFGRAPEAYQYLQSGAHLGKVLLTLPGI